METLIEQDPEDLADQVIESLRQFEVETPVVKKSKTTKK